MLRQRTHSADLRQALFAEQRSGRTIRPAALEWANADRSAGIISLRCAHYKMRITGPGPVPELLWANFTDSPIKLADYPSFGIMVPRQGPEQGERCGSGGSVGSRNALLPLLNHNSDGSDVAADQRRQLCADVCRTR